MSTAGSTPIYGTSIMSFAGLFDFVQLKGARHASARFVTGCLDRVDSRPQFLDLVRSLNEPVLVIYGDETPPRSRAEMDALAELPNVRMERLPKGKLSIHEEFPASIASIIRPFLMARRASLY